MDIARVLKQLKEEGNDAFKAGDWAGAFAKYSEALKKNRGNARPDPGSETEELLAVLYANRAAAALKLRKYEQVISDASMTTRLTSASGCSDSDVRVLDGLLSTYVKARLRRAAAFEQLGNYMAAWVDYMKAGAQVNDTHALRRGEVLGETFVSYPIRWGASIAHLPGLTVPAAPPKRSSASVEGVVVKRLGCRLPPSCLFMSCVAWRGRIYVFGGGDTNPLSPDMSDALLVLDPGDESVTAMSVLPDPRSQQQHGLPGRPLPRFRQTMVLWRDAIYMYGGDLPDNWHQALIASLTGTGMEGSIADAEARTVWRLDLQAEPLRWQRIVCSGAHPVGRRDHSAVVWNDHMVVYGGLSTQSFRMHGDLGDCWAFDLVRHTWRRLAPRPELRRMGTPAIAPEPRREHAAWVHRDWMYVLGGSSTEVQNCEVAVQEGYTINAYTFTDMWRLHLGEHRWEHVIYSGNFPCARSEMAVAVSPRGSVYLAGGYTTACCTPHRGAFGQRSMLSSAYSPEIFEFCCINHYFRRLVTNDMQPALGRLRAAAAACWLDNQMYVVGGYNTLTAPPTLHPDVVAIDVRVCAHCGVRKADAPRGKLQQCARCKELGRSCVYYCSTECMQQDWPTHKVVCSERGILP